MKNKPLLSVVPAVLLLCSAAAAESRLFLGAGANYIRPADENYRTAYGGQAIYPEIWGAVRLVAGLCLSGSYGRFAKDGLTPVLELEARATQSYFTAGLTYLQRISGLLCLQAGGGVADIGRCDTPAVAIAPADKPLRALLRIPNTSIRRVRPGMVRSVQAPAARALLGCGDRGPPLPMSTTRLPKPSFGPATRCETLATSTLGSGSEAGETISITWASPSTAMLSLERCSHSRNNTSFSRYCAMPFSLSPMIIRSRPLSWRPRASTIFSTARMLR